MSNDLVVKAIDAVINNEAAFCKFLSANDSGETGGHQSGILISTTAGAMFFTEQEMRENHILKKIGHIKWQDDYSTSCTFTWYESKRELRITGFGRGKSPLCPELTGALFVMIKENEDYYQGYIFTTDDDIQEFLDSFGLTPVETNRPIEAHKTTAKIRENDAIEAFINSLTVEFPSSSEMSQAARLIYDKAYRDHNQAVTNPDNTLLEWTDEEFVLFQALEQARYGSIIAEGFGSVNDFATVANQVLNRRKSRAGKSLEHHLSAIFDENRIRYTAQAVTEGNKRPDFLFPSEEAYHDDAFPTEMLCTLAAKTTCKDRWRQILNEADRLRDDYKYLCTMQRGISAMQMDEMRAEKVVLVVPKAYHSAYPKEKRDQIWTLAHFISYIKEMEGIS